MARRSHPTATLLPNSGALLRTICSRNESNCAMLQRRIRVTAKSSKSSQSLWLCRLSMSESEVSSELELSLLSKTSEAGAVLLNSSKSMSRHGTECQRYLYLHRVHCTGLDYRSCALQKQEGEPGRHFKFVCSQQSAEFSVQRKMFWNHVKLEAEELKIFCTYM
jgi:hypothetical protein